MSLILGFVRSVSPGLPHRIVAGALALALAGGFGWLAIRDRDGRLAAAEQQADAAATRAARSLYDTLDTPLRLLASLAETAAKRSDWPADPALRRLVDAAPEMARDVRGAALFDADGEVTTQSALALDEAPFAALAAQSFKALTTASTAPIVVGGEGRDGDPGEIVGLARGWRDADGRLAGFALLAIDPRVFSGIADGKATVLRADGTPLVGQARLAPQAVSAQVPDLALSMSYQRSTDAVHRQWRDVWIGRGLILVLVAGFAALGTILWRTPRRTIPASPALSQPSEAPAQLNELAAALRGADETNRTKSQYFAEVTHELRTPLTAILGFAEAIRSEWFGPIGNPRYGEYAGLIHEAGGHLLSLIDDLLDTAKLEAGKMEIAPIRVSAAALAHSALDLVGLSAAQRDIELVTEGAETCPDLHVDLRAAKQVLVNLLSNAIKYTGQGGQVELRFAGRADGSVAVIVADSGIGMSVDELKLAFEPFGRAARGHARGEPGTGLGLPLARSLVRLHCGELTLASEPGHGTTATAVFPAEPGGRGTATTIPLAIAERLPPVKAA